MKVFQRVLAKAGSVLLLAGAFVLMSAARSDAALIVYVCDDAICTGGPQFTINDNGLGDSDGTLGQISVEAAGYPGSISASTKPVLGSAVVPALNLHYSLGTDAFAAMPTPYIFAAEDGFLLGGLATFQANATFQSGGTAALFSGAGTFVPSPALGLLNCASVAAGGCTLMAPVGAVTPYYLALRVGPTPTIIGASGDASVQVTSVPDGGSTAALLGSVLVGFGMLRRRFSKR